MSNDKLALRKIVAITSRSIGMTEAELGLSMGRIQEICEAALAAHEAEKQAPTPDNLMQRLGNFPTPEVSGEVAEKQAGPVAEPVGEAVSMPGTSGFTMACFKSADAPIGTKLYTAPPSPLTEQDKEDAGRYTIDEITEAVLYAEIPDGQFKSMLVSLDAIRAARAKKEQP